MRLQPANKALKPETTKDSQTTSEASDQATDAGLAMYPAADGWQPVYDRFGTRYGFYRHADGLKDDPTNARWCLPASDGVMERVYASPEYANAAAAVALAEATMTNVESDYFAATDALTTFELQLGAAQFIEHPKGTSNYVWLTADGRKLGQDDTRREMRRLRTAIEDVDRQRARAERDVSRDRAELHRVIDGLSRAIREGRT